MKQCSKCKQNKEFVEFCKRRSSKDGYGILCKLCRILINSQNKLNRQKWWKQYYQKNKKIICAKKIIYRLKNPDKIQKIKQKSYLKHKNTIKLRYINKKHQKTLEISKDRSLSLSEYLNN